MIYFNSGGVKGNCIDNGYGEYPNNTHNRIMLQNKKGRSQGSPLRNKTTFE